jgi:hypothetical protein
MSESEVVAPGDRVLAAAGGRADEVSDEELGPIDYIVVEFPEGQTNFTGAAAAQLVALVESTTIRVLDLIFVHKNDDGSIDVDELEDVHDLGPLGSIVSSLAEVLAESDLMQLAQTLTPGSRAAVLVWENTWAAPFAVALRETGARLVAADRIPTQALIASMQQEGE